MGRWEQLCASAAPNLAPANRTCFYHFCFIRGDGQKSGCEAAKCSRSHVASSSSDLAPFQAALDKIRRAGTEAVYANPSDRRSSRPPEASPQPSRHQTPAVGRPRLLGEGFAPCGGEEGVLARADSSDAGIVMCTTLVWGDTEDEAPLDMMDLDRGGLTHGTYTHGPWHGHAGLKFTGSPKGKA